MFCDFRKAFGLDPEYNKQLEESIREAEKKALKEKWCWENLRSCFRH